MRDEYDVIVVGGGLGGLSAGAFLAKAGLRTIVLERHSVPGGYCTDYRRRGFHFDSAVHYLGRPDLFLEILGALDVADRVTMAPMDPDGFDVYRFPDFQFRVPSSTSRLEERLQDKFPREKRGIRRYVRHLSHFIDIASQARNGMGPGFLSSFPLRHTRLLPYMRTTLGTFLGRITSDARLKAVLGAHWGIHGTVPSSLPLFLALGGMAHYMEGSWYPAGGTGKISRAMSEALKGYGGELRLRSEVERVLCDGGKAVGVELPEEERIYGNRIIMAGDVWDGVERLLKEAPLRPSLRARVGRLDASNSMVHLHVGLSSVPRSWKWGSCNIWNYPGHDFDRLYGELKTTVLPERTATFSSVGYMKNPDCSPEGGKYGPSVSVLAPADPRHFSPYMSMVGRKRTREYRALKEDLEARMIKAAEDIFPGIGSSARYVEVATPFTQYRYTLSRLGCSYGFARNMQNWYVGKPAWYRPLKNVWWTGANGGFHGVIGALQTGLLTAADVSGINPGKLKKPLGRKR